MWRLAVPLHFKMKLNRVVMQSRQKNLDTENEHVHGRPQNYSVDLQNLQDTGPQHDQYLGKGQA